MISASTPSLPTTVPVPPGCPEDVRGWLQSALAVTSHHRVEAEHVLDVLDGRRVSLTDEARTWLERVALETTRPGGHARELLQVCGGVL